MGIIGHRRNRGRSSVALIVASLLAMAIVVVPTTNATAAVDTPPGMPADILSTAVKNDSAFVWAAIGDSYGSGEGAPATTKTYLWNELNYSGLVWSSRDEFYKPAPNGSASLAADTTTCHRSTKSAAAVVNDRIKSKYRITPILGHVACSGASTQHLTTERYTGPGSIPESLMGLPRTTQPPQIERIAEMKKSYGRLDAVYVSIGGNDSGFGSILSNCLRPFWSDCTWDEGTLKSNLRALPGKYAAVDTALDSRFTSATPVFITAYPNPLQDASNGNPPVCVDRDYDLRGETQAGGWDDSTQWEISEGEAKWAYGIPARINSVMKTAATAAGWTYVDSHLTALRGRGMCTANSAFNLNSDALHKQGRDLDKTFNYSYSTGFVHPNASGYQAYADALYASMEPTIIAKVRAGLVTPSRVRAASATSSGITLRWDDRSTSDTSMLVTVSPSTTADVAAIKFPIGAVVRNDGSYTLTVDASNQQEWTLPTLRSGSFKVSFAACNSALTTDRCSASSAPLTVTNAIPPAPSATRIVINRWTLKATLTWTGSPTAIDYVVRRTPPRGTPTTSRTSVTSTDVSTLPATDLLDIAACNRAGCSAWVRVAH